MDMTIIMLLVNMFSLFPINTKDKMKRIKPQIRNL